MPTLRPAFRCLAFAVVGTAFGSVVIGVEPTANWANFTGNGTFSPPAEGIGIDLAHARLAWEHKEPMGVQKTNAAKDGEFYGATACVIAADGAVFASYIRPSGDVLNEKTTNRYYALDKQPHTLKQIDGDDVTVALSADTGKLLWRAEEKGASLNFLFGKRGHYGVTPAYNNNTVFTFGGIGMLFAYDAKTGAKKWEAPVEPFHTQAAAAKQKSLAEKTILDTYGKAALFEDLRTGVVAVDNVVVAPNGKDGLVAFDAATGKSKWILSNVIARGATPTLWRHNDRNYLLCPVGRKNSGKISLVSPDDGKVLWTKDYAGPAHTSLVVHGDRTFFNTRGNMLTGAAGPQGDVKEGSGLLACYQLTLEGPKELWRFEDAAENWVAIRPDRGMNRRIAFRGNTGYLLIGEPQALVAVDMTNGKILQRGEKLGGTACSPVVVEDSLILPLDLSHSWGSVSFAAFTLKSDGTFTRLGDITGEGALKISIVTDYEVANEAAFYKGRMYVKTRAGLAAVDLRK